MPQSQLPDLEAIRALPGTLRFLGAVGAAVSLFASIELLYFDLFVAAKGTDPQTLAESFYLRFDDKGAHRIQASKRRDCMDKAISRTLSTNQAEWSSLVSRLKTLTGDNSLRHFVAHTAATFVEGDFSDEFDANDYKVDEFIAIQDALQAVANGVNARIEDFDSTITYCRELESIYTDLSQFHVRYQAGER